MIRMHPIVLSATFGVLLGGGVAFAEEYAFFSAQDSLGEVISRLESMGEGQSFSNPSIDAKRTRAVRALASRLLAEAELTNGTALEQGLH
jgi:hypothetical protein